MDAVLGITSIGEGSTTSVQSKSCRQRAKGTSRSQFELDNSKPSQKGKTGEPDGVLSMHGITGPDNPSPDNLSGLWGASSNGSLLGSGPLQEHGGARTWSTYSLLDSTHAPSAVHMLHSPLSTIDLSSPIYGQMGLFDDLSEAEQYNTDSRQSTVSGEWDSHEFTAAADYDQGQGSNPFGSCGSEQPTLTDVASSNSARVPFMDYTDDTNGDFWHMITLSAGADIGPEPSNAELAPNMFHGPF